MITLPLTGIVDVNVNVSAVATIRNAFNTALIVGGSTRISTATRVKSYSGLAAMVADGFLVTDPEYMAAALYFAQTPTPQKVYIGVKDSAETLLVALTACRTANSDWYVAVPTEDLVDALLQADAVALATYVESAVPSSMLALSFNDPATYLPIITALHSGNYSRTISMFDDVAANAGKTAIAGIIGYAMGANTESAKAFALAYKSITGLTAKTDFTSVQLEALLTQCGNIYINQATNYNLFRQGKMANGVSFDEVLFMDMLVERLKYNIMTLLTTTPKIPQTNSGINSLTNAMSEACEIFLTKNFLAAGTWTGANILNLTNGDTLPNGYLVQFATLESQSQADREARIAPNSYVCIKTAGAIEHVVIAVTVNR